MDISLRLIENEQSGSKMQLLQRIFILLAVMATVIYSEGAHAQGFEDFYEIIVDPSESLTSCENGVISEVVDKITNEHSAQFDLLCMPKWYMVRDTQRNTVLLIPYNISENTTALSVRWDMKYELQNLLEICSEVPSTCLMNDFNHSFERQAYEYQGFEELTFFVNEFYDFNSFYKQLIDSDIESLIRTQVVKLVQINLTELGYNPRGIDGSLGSGTRAALEQFFANLPEDKKDDYGQFRSDVVIEHLFPNLLKYQPKQQTPSTNFTENEPSVDNEDGAGISAVNVDTTADVKLDDQPKSSTEPEGIITAQPTSDQSNQILKLENANKQFELDVLSLKSQLKEEQELYESLKAENKRLAQQLLNLNQQPITQLWNSKTQQGIIKFLGESPDNKQVELTVLESGFDGRACLLEVNKSLNEQYMEQLTRPRCFKVVLQDYDEDNNTGRMRNYDSENKVMIIPVMKKQSEVIQSISATGLDNFEEGDFPSCYLGLKLINQDGTEEADNISLYLSMLDDEVLLSDLGVVAELGIKWNDRKFQFINTTPEGMTSSCLITSNQQVPIIKEEQDPRNNAPVAIISRNGDITLKNLPLVKKEAPELHVFLDTLAGPKGDELYGFNPALNGLEEQQTQIRYFTGFLKGVQSFLIENQGIEKVTIHHSIMINKNRETIGVQTFLRDDTTSDEPLLPVEFIETYMSSFAAGVEGEFDNKKRTYSRLLSSNGNSLFVTFGSSGLNPGRVCQSAQPRADYGNNTVIFDVVPASTLDRLDENDSVKTIEPGFAVKCVDSEKIVVLRPRPNRDDEDVRKVVSGHLTAVWRY